MTQEPNWNISDLLAGANGNDRRRRVPSDRSPTAYMRAGLGWEDWVAAFGIDDPEARERIRLVFIPKLRRPQ